MTLLHPLIFFSGLAAVSIPILIHLLLRRKRRPVRWAAMRFLVEAHRRRRRRRTLEQILLLAARCLLIAVLAAAIARPVFGPEAGAGGRTLVLVIDNSLTSGLRDASGRTTLDRHKQTALELIDRLAAGPGDRVALLTAAAPASAVITPATLDIDAARERINAIEPTDSAMDLAGVLALLPGSVEPESGETRAVLISDWRRGSGLGEYPDSGDAPAPPPFPVRITAPAADDPPNLRLVSLSAGRGVVLPGDPSPASQAIATIVREGGDLPEARALLKIESIGRGETMRTEQAFTLPEGERSVAVPVVLDLPGQNGDDEGGDLALRAGVRTKAPIDAIEADSTLLRTIRVRRTVRVGVVHARRGGGSLERFDAADWVRTALKPDPLTPIEIREINAPGLSSAADLAGLDAAVLTRPDLLSGEAWAACAAFVDRGGTLVIFPPNDPGAQRWPDAMRTALGIETEFSREPVLLDPPSTLEPGPAAGTLPLLSGDLAPLAGGVTVTRALRAEARRDRVVLAAAGGGAGIGAFLFVPRDRVWVFASPPDTAWTDLPAKPLMLPLMQEIVRRSAAPVGAASSIAGTRPAVRTGAVELIHLESGSRLDLTAGPTSAPTRAGVWEARGARGERLGIVAVTPDHRAGRTGPLGVDEVLGSLRENIPDADVIEETGDNDARLAADTGPIGRLFFLVAAGLALLETFAARVASRVPGGERIG